MKDYISTVKNKKNVNNKKGEINSANSDEKMQNNALINEIDGITAHVYSWEANFSSSTIYYSDLFSEKTGSWTFYEFMNFIEKNDADNLYKFFLTNETDKPLAIDIDIKINIEEEQKWFKIKGYAKRVSSECEFFASGVAYNIDKTQQYKKRLEYLETHDYLTGLFNLNVLDEAIRSCVQNNEGSQTLVVANIDNLKDINDTLGYSAGNTLIKNVANVIKECFEDAEIIARVSGGEYCALFIGKNKLEIDMMLKEANMILHRMYLNLIKTEVTFGYTTSKTGSNFTGLYRQAVSYMQKQKKIKSALSNDSVIDVINETLSRKTGWGKRSVRLQSLALQIGKELGFTEECLNEIKVLSKIADIGLVCIDDDLVKERMSLSGKRKMQYLKHVEYGREIISRLDNVSDMEKSYLDIYKRYDEYKGELSLASMVIAVSIRFDDIVSSDNSIKFSSIKLMLTKEKETIYCPKVVDVVIGLMGKNYA